MLKESCVEGYSEALKAEKHGANRVELCENLNVGGTTPSYGIIKMTVENLKIPVAVMIRPRGGDFVYSSDEIEIMKEDIKICKNFKVESIVLGVLTKDNTIDYPLLKELIELAKPLKIVFHKAIDEIKNPADEVKKLADIGVDRILTSGGKPTAFEGQDCLNKMIENANNKIKIVVAGKVTKKNIDELSSLIKSDEFHGKLIV